MQKREQTLIEGSGIPNPVEIRAAGFTISL
jgi:hypothetical protein